MFSCDEWNAHQWSKKPVNPLKPSKMNQKSSTIYHSEIYLAHLKISEIVIYQLQLGFFTKLKSHSRNKLRNNEEDNSNHIT
jgi:hypothetical protein